MKAVIEFELPDDEEAFHASINAWKYKAALDEIDNWLRGLSKHECKEAVSIEEVRRRLSEALRDA